jgi:hypothetical protein
MMSWRNSPMRMNVDIEGTFIFLVAIDQPMDLGWFQVTTVHPCAVS